MCNSCELLNYIYKITVIFIIRIDSIDKKINNNKVKYVLKSYKRNYLNIVNKIKKELIRCNGAKDRVNVIDKIVNKCIFINNEEKILKNYINLCNKSIKDINIKLSTYDYSNKRIIKLCNELLICIIDNSNLFSKYI